MATGTQVYAIGIYVYGIGDKSDITVYRFDPRVKDGDHMRVYRRFTSASLARVKRLLEGGSVKYDGQVRVKRFHPSPKADVVEVRAQMARHVGDNARLVAEVTALRAWNEELEGAARRLLKEVITLRTQAAGDGDEDKDTTRRRFEERELADLRTQNRISEDLIAMLRERIAELEGYPRIEWRAS